MCDRIFSYSTWKETMTLLQTSGGFVHPDTTSPGKCDLLICSYFRCPDYNWKLLRKWPFQTPNSWDSGCSLNAQWPRMLPLEKTRGNILSAAIYIPCFNQNLLLLNMLVYRVGLFTESPSRLFPLTFTFTLHAGSLDIAFTLKKPIRTSGV